MNTKIKSILIDNISSEWKSFAHGAVFDKDIIDYIDHDKPSNQLKMDELLEMMVIRNPSNYISDIKKSLLLMGKTDVLNEILFVQANDLLKAHYLKNYGTIVNEGSQINDLCLFSNNLKMASIEEDKMKEINDCFNEWEHFLHRRSSFKEANFKELSDVRLPVILISGISGIGKTYFLQKCLCYWANELLWKNVQFVFYFQFKTINQFQSISSIIELTKKFYKNILNGYEISLLRRLMFIFDGLDEFHSLEQLVNHKSGALSTIPMINALGEILRSQNSSCIFSGSVTAVTRYWRTIKDYKDVANIQIMGLSNRGSKSFLKDLLLSKTLKTDIEKLTKLSPYVRGLLSVPLYFKAAYSALHKLNIQSLKTITEMQTLIFFHFLQQNIKSKEPLPRIIHVNQQHILKVCELAFTMLDRGKVNFPKKELESVLDENGLEPLGFIKKSNIDQQYEFVHGFLVKFCASIHLLFNVKSHDIIKNEKWRDCLPVITGFVYGNDGDLLSLISRLKEPLHKQTCWLRDVSDLLKDDQHGWIDRNARELYIKCFYEAQELGRPIAHKQGWHSEENYVLAAEEVSENEYFDGTLIDTGGMKLAQLKSSVNFTLENKCDHPIICSADTFLPNASVILQGQENQIDAINQNFQLAKSFYIQQQFDNAEECFRDVESVQKDVLGEKHLNTLNTKNCIAMCLYEKQQFNNAEKIFRVVENIRKEILGEKHSDTLTAKYWVAMCLFEKQQYNDAEKIFRLVENMRKEVLGERHSDTLTTKYMIGICLFGKQQFDDAEGMFRDLENIRKVVLGEKHLDTLTSKHWLARCLCIKQQYDIAEEMFRDVEKVRKEILGEIHMDTLNTKYLIARCLYDRQQFDSAEGMFREIEDIQTIVLGEKNMNTLTSKYWVARCLYVKEQYDIAEEIFRKVEKLQKEILGEKHTDTINTKYLIARCLYERQRFNNAEQMFRYIENMLMEVLGEKHVDTLNAKNWIGCCLYKKMLFDDAEKIFRDVATIRKKVLGKSHEDTLMAKYMIKCCIDNRKKDCIVM